MMRRSLSFCLTLALFLFLSGCGGGGDGLETNSEPSSSTLESLDVSPSNVTVTKGDVVSLGATGTYADGTTADLTDKVTWSSADSAVATVSTRGLVTGVRAGTATITASLSGVTADASVIIEAPGMAFGVSAAGGPRTLRFSWKSTGDASADHFTLLVNADGASGYQPVPGADNRSLSATNFDLSTPVHLTDWVNARYRLEERDAGGTALASEEISLMSAVDSADVIGYFKASNPEASDNFGKRVALSADGSTLAVSALDEDSAATGINGNESDNSASGSGAVYVYSRDGTGNWAKEAYLKPDAGIVDFGHSLDLSTDGSTLAVGSGKYTADYRVYIFVRDSSGTWSEQNFLVGTGTDYGDDFGWSVSLSGDGNKLAIGSPREDSSAKGLNGDYLDNTADQSGAVFIYSRDHIGWSQEAYLKASNTDIGDLFGYSVALSTDASTLAVGALYERSGATGVDGDQLDNGTADAGAVYVFRATGTPGVWYQEAYIKASNTGFSHGFGDFLDISVNGNTLAVAAPYEGSSATGVNGDDTDNSAPASGAVYVFDRASLGSWSQTAYLKASNTDSGDNFGYGVALAETGDLLAVGAHSEEGWDTGVGGDQSSNSRTEAGAAYVFSRDSGGLWQQTAYLKASNTGDYDNFGARLDLSSDGSLLAIGAFGEDGGSTGIGGDATDDSAPSAGAVYLY